MAGTEAGHMREDAERIRFVVRPPISDQTVTRPQGARQAGGRMIRTRIAQMRTGDRSGVPELSSPPGSSFPRRPVATDPACRAPS